MKLKYYLRGIGIGILVTVLVLFIAGKFGGVGISDDEVIKRAKQLGMVEGNTMSKKVNQAIEESTEEISLEDVTVEVPTEPETKEDAAKKEDAAADDKAKADEKAADKADAAKAAEAAADKAKDQSGKDAKVNITKGMDSYTVADLMKKAGIISDADDFNKYLVKNKYDSIIRVGEKSFTKGMTYEEMAKVLTAK